MVARLMAGRRLAEAKLAKGRELTAECEHDPSTRVVMAPRLVFFGPEAEIFRGLAHALSSERAEANSRKASAFDSTTARRGALRTDPGRTEKLIILSSFFIIDFSVVDFRASGWPPARANLISEFCQLPVPAPPGSLSFHVGNRRMFPILPEF
jgi:hypothetical protein